MEFGDFYTEAVCEDNIPEILRICKEYLGEGIYTREFLKGVIGKEKHYFDLLRCKAGSPSYVEALGEGGEADAIAGLCYCFAGAAQEVADGVGIGLEDIEAAAPKPAEGEEALYGAFKSVAVVREFRGGGLSVDLLDAYSGRMFAQDKILAGFCTAWVRGEKVPAKNQLESCGFRFARRVKHPWAKDADLKCPECKQMPCSCDGVLYTKTREDFLLEHRAN